MTKITMHLKELLRHTGSRATPGRVELLRILALLKEPVTVGELVKRFKGKLDKVTLYRALEALVGAGVVRRIDFQHGHVHYELGSATAHHHHLVCRSCGKVEDVDCSHLPSAKVVLKASKHFAKVEDHALEFFGICKSCSRK